MILAQFIIFHSGLAAEWTEIIVIFMPIFIPLAAALQHRSTVSSACWWRLTCQTAFLSPPVAMAAFLSGQGRVAAARDAQPDLRRHDAVHGHPGAGAGTAVYIPADRAVAAAHALAGAGRAGRIVPSMLTRPPASVCGRLRWTASVLVALAFVPSFFHRAFGGAVAGEPRRRSRGQRRRARFARGVVLHYLRPDAGADRRSWIRRRALHRRPGGVIAGAGSILFGLADTLWTASLGRLLVGLACRRRFSPCSSNT